jgi:hypothetical protein
VCANQSILMVTALFDDTRRSPRGAAARISTSSTASGGETTKVTAGVVVSWRYSSEVSIGRSLIAAIAL